MPSSEDLKTQFQPRVKTSMIAPLQRRASPSKYQDTAREQQQCPFRVELSLNRLFRRDYSALSIPF